MLRVSSSKKNPVSASGRLSAVTSLQALSRTHMAVTKNFTISYRTKNNVGQIPLKQPCIMLLYRTTRVPQHHKTKEATEFDVVPCIILQCVDDQRDAQFL